MIDRERIIKIARGWIGTRYHHQASLKGVGCDCIGLVRGVYEEYFGIKINNIPNYSRDWGDCDGNEMLIKQGCVYFNEINKDEIQPGDIVALRWIKYSVAKHVAIVSFDGKMIHAYNGHPVFEVNLSDWWKRKIAYAYCFPEIPKVV